MYTVTFEFMPIKLSDSNLVSSENLSNNNNLAKKMYIIPLDNFKKWFWNDLIAKYSFYCISNMVSWSQLSFLYSNVQKIKDLFTNTYVKSYMCYTLL